MKPLDYRQWCWLRTIKGSGRRSWLTGMSAATINMLAPIDRHYLERWLNQDGSGHIRLTDAGLAACDLPQPEQ